MTAYYLATSGTLEFLDFGGSLRLGQQGGRTEPERLLGIPTHVDLMILDTYLERNGFIKMLLGKSASLNGIGGSPATSSSI